MEIKRNHLLLLVSYFGTALLLPIKITTMQINPQNLINESIFFVSWSLGSKFYFDFDLEVLSNFKTHKTVFNPLGRGFFPKWWTINDWYEMLFTTMVLYIKCLSQTTEFEQKENCVLLQQVFFSPLLFLFSFSFVVIVVFKFSFLFLVNVRCARAPRYYCFLHFVRHSWLNDQTTNSIMS